MALIKEEWIIRKTSTISIDSANSYIRGQLDEKQDATENLNSSGGYIDNFFADLFDSRDGSLYRIYSVGATNASDVIDGDADAGDSYFNVVLTSDVIEQIEQSGTFVTVTDATNTYATKGELPDLTDYRIESEIVQIVDNKVQAIQIDEVIIG
jgi:hypothetical protein